MGIDKITFKLNRKDYTIKLDNPIYAGAFDYASISKQAREIVGNYMKENGIEGDAEILLIDSSLF